MSYEELEELKYVGESPTGKVFQQDIYIGFEEERIKSRRVVIRLNEPTRDGDPEVAVLTNFTQENVGGIVISELYLKRWTVVNVPFLLVHLNRGRVKSYLVAAFH